MAIERRSRARINAGETADCDDTVERIEQQQQQPEQHNLMGEEGFSQLASMVGKQIDLLAKQKVMQVEHMEQVTHLVGDVKQRLK